MVIMEKISKILIDRLICAKYLYNKGKELLDSESHYASGLAVIHFQDATELVLRVIAEYHHVNLKNPVAFNQIIDSIDKKADEIGLNRLTHRSSLNSLNHSRNGFKHLASRPDINEVRKYSRDLAEFFPIALKNFLSLDYENLSSVELINHKRTANWLKKAEDYLNKLMYPEAAASSAVAFEIFRNFSTKRSIWGWKKRSNLGHELYSRARINNEKADNTAYQLALDTDEKLNEIMGNIDVIFDGIDPSSFKKFLIYTPRVDFGKDNSLLHPNLLDKKELDKFYLDEIPEITPAIANFCYRYAVDSILKLQELSLPPVFEKTEPEIKYSVIKEAPIYVSPNKNEKLRDAKADEIVISYKSIKNKDEHDLIAIFDDNITAFITKESVKLIS